MNYAILREKKNGRPAKRREIERNREKQKTESKGERYTYIMKIDDIERNEKTREFQQRYGQRERNGQRERGSGTYYS